MKSRLAIWTIALCYLVDGRAFAKETILLPMRDGVKLATDVHKPEGTNSLPVILGRTPYNKNGLDGIGAEAIKRGFILVAQDCRGRFASEGENLPFNLDGPDGFDTLEWIAKQPWCNGRIGTWGGSAGAITQFQMVARPTSSFTSIHSVRLMWSCRLSPNPNAREAGTNNVSFDLDPRLRYSGAENKRRAWQQFFAARTGPIAYDVRDLNVTVQGDMAFVYSLNHVSGTLASSRTSNLWVRWTAWRQRREEL